MNLLFVFKSRAHPLSVTQHQSMFYNNNNKNKNKFSRYFEYLKMSRRRRRQSYKNVSLAERNHCSETGRPVITVMSTRPNKTGKGGKNLLVGPAEEPSKNK
jgi:hypothetical protein